MTGRMVFEKFISPNFYAYAQKFTEHKSLRFDNRKEAVEFLVLYGCLLKSHGQPYDESRFQQDFHNLKKELQEHSSFELFGKKYSLLEENKICSIT